MKYTVNDCICIFWFFLLPFVVLWIAAYAMKFVDYAAWYGYAAVISSVVLVCFSLFVSVMGIIHFTLKMKRSQS